MTAHPNPTHARHGAQPFDPREYWENRHRALRGSLRAVGHLQLPEESNALQYEIKRSHLLGMIRRQVDAPAGKRLLDAGCGTGVFAPAWLEMGFDAVGVDFSPTAVEQARARGLAAEFVVSPLASLELHRKFDVITAVDVFLHVVCAEQLRAGLAALARHLRPQGVLIVLDRLSDAGHPSPPHVRHQTLEWYEHTFAELGLRIAEHERFPLEVEGVTKDLLAVRHRCR